MIKGVEKYENAVGDKMVRNTIEWIFRMSEFSLIAGAFAYIGSSQNIVSIKIISILLFVSMGIYICSMFVRLKPQKPRNFSEVLVYFLLMVFLLLMFSAFGSVFEVYELGLGI